MSTTSGTFRVSLELSLLIFGIATVDISFDSIA